MKHRTSVLAVSSLLTGVLLITSGATSAVAKTNIKAKAVKKTTKRATPKTVPTTQATTTSTVVQPTTTTVAVAASAVDRTRLVLGDGKSASVPTVGMVYSCNPGTAKSSGNDRPWLNGDGTWNAILKPTVQGDVAWAAAQVRWLTSATTRGITGTGLPPHSTGVFPIQKTDPVFTYDRNPNSISAQTISVNIALQPKLAANPTCMSGGAIGYTLTGVALFNGFDADQRDAPAHEIQDRCGGHPEKNGAYHYHNLSTCLDNSGSGHSPLVGYALDGFGIFGNRGVDGVELTNASLDECHGHSHDVAIDGVMVNQYHYHATAMFPYTVGCFRGTPTRLGPNAAGAGGAAPSGGATAAGGQPARPPAGKGGAPRRSKERCGPKVCPPRFGDVSKGSNRGAYADSPPASTGHSDVVR
jgi:YHYH protein